MRYALAAILLIAAVIPDGSCGSNSFFSSRLCRFEGPNPIHEGLRRTYVNCVRNADGTFTAQHKRCPIGQLFDSATLQCSTATRLVSGRTRSLVKRQAVTTQATTTVPTPVPTFMPTPAPIHCNFNMFSCANCTALRVCSKSEDNTFEFKHDITCTGTKPFCNPWKSACVSTLPEGCDSGFHCLSAGYFPDVRDCTIFHYCFLDYSRRLRDAQGYCAPGYVFSGDLGACKPKGNVSECHVARCPEDANGLYEFEGEPKYYVACEFGSATFVAACPENQEFSNANGECEVVCKAVGKIADLSNCRSYYECTATTVQGPPYKASRKNCPGGYFFNATSKKCVIGYCSDIPS